MTALPEMSLRSRAVRRPGMSLQHSPQLSRRSACKMANRPAHMRLVRKPEARGNFAQRSVTRSDACHRLPTSNGNPIFGGRATVGAAEAAGECSGRHPMPRAHSARETADRFLSCRASASGQSASSGSRIVSCSSRQAVASWTSASASRTSWSASRTLANAEQDRCLSGSTRTVAPEDPMTLKCGSLEHRSTVSPGASSLRPTSPASPNRPSRTTVTCASSCP